MHARNILDLAWLIPAFPAFGAVLLLLFGKRIGEPKAGWIATALIGVVVRRVGDRVLRAALAAPGSTGERLAGLHLDPGGNLPRRLPVPRRSVVVDDDAVRHRHRHAHLDCTRSGTCTATSASRASSRTSEPLRRPRCSCSCSGSSFLMTFMGWEGVGLCSYLLISFWFERNSAAVAGKKAFITNRVGDFGFMLAMFLIFQKLGTLDYSALPAAHAAPAVGRHRDRAACCSSARWARARSSRCTSGCPTRWKARPRSRP